MTWLDFWTMLLVLTLRLFAVLAVVVAIGGLFDIQRMFRTLTKNREKTQTDATSREEAR